MRVGRALGAAVVGALFLLFVAIDLVLLGVIPLASPVVTIFPAIGFVLAGSVTLWGTRRQHG
jgi:hypothetical protein